jgi:hypothetical protein
VTVKISLEKTPVIGGVTGAKVAFYKAREESHGPSEVVTDIYPCLDLRQTVIGFIPLSDKKE